MTTRDERAAAAAATLPRIGSRPPFGAYLAEAWRRRAFALELARVRVTASNSKHKLGMWWVVVQPTMMAIIFGTIFGVILPSSSRPDNFIPFLVVGIFVFQLYSKSSTSTARSIVGNRGLVQSLSFPRILLPVSAAIEHLLQFLPALGVMVIILVGFGEPLAWSWLLLVPMVAFFFLFNLGVGLVLARLTVHLNDMTQILPLVNRIFFYTSGIFYSLDLVLKGREEILFATRLNPVSDFVQIVRSQVIEGVTPTTLQWVVAALATGLLLVGGAFYFWRTEERYGHE